MPVQSVAWEMASTMTGEIPERSLISAVLSGWPRGCLARSRMRMGGNRSVSCQKVSRGFIPLKENEPPAELCQQP